MKFLRLPLQLVAFLLMVLIFVQMIVLQLVTLLALGLRIMQLKTQMTWAKIVTGNNGGAS